MLFPSPTVFALCNNIAGIKFLSFPCAKSIKTLFVELVSFFFFRNNQVSAAIILNLARHSRSMAFERVITWSRKYPREHLWDCGGFGRGGESGRQVGQWSYMYVLHNTVRKNPYARLKHKEILLRNDKESHHCAQRSIPSYLFVVPPPLPQTIHKGSPCQATEDSHSKWAKYLPLY